MAKTRKMTQLCVVVATVVVSGFVISQTLMNPSSTAAAYEMPDTAPYAPQKAVYHIASGGGWFGHDHRNRLQSIENHVAAVPVGDLQLAVVLQGDGITLLTDAKNDAALGQRIDVLRAKGVTFLICRNTIIGRHIDLEALHGARRQDVVGAGVAEVTRLQQMGYAYLRI